MARRSSENHPVKRTGNSETIYMQLYTKYAEGLTGRKGPVKSWTFGWCRLDRLMAIAERSPKTEWLMKDFHDISQEMNMAQSRLDDPRSRRVVY